MSQQKRVLIVTEEFDPHADIIVERLTARGRTPVRLHTSDIPTRAGFSWKLESDHVEGCFSIDGRCENVPLEAISSVLWRRPDRYAVPPQLSSREARFALEEIKHAMNGLWASLNCRWVNRPDLNSQATWKPAQLKRAKEFGFNVPRTIISTRPEDALEFFDSCRGRVLCKVLSDPFLAQSRIRPSDKNHSPSPDTGSDVERPLLMLARLIDRATLLENLACIRNSPCVLQEYIEKQFELRVTIIGHSVFTAHLDSQSNAGTSIDWRHYDVKMPVKEGSLPVDVERRCVRFMESYGLAFSTMDLIVTRTGDYIFLENNPNGQWMWVEDRVPELKMVDAMCDLLTAEG